MPAPRGEQLLTAPQADAAESHHWHSPATWARAALRLLSTAVSSHSAAGGTVPFLAAVCDLDLFLAFLTDPHVTLTACYDLTRYEPLRAALD